MGEYKYIRIVDNTWERFELKRSQRIQYEHWRALWGKSRSVSWVYL